MNEARLLRRALLAAAAAAAALGLAAGSALADEWGQRVPGQHVYDLAGALTPAQASDLERSAAAVDQAGAPTIVYVRRKDADDATTQQDARALMDAWTIESSPGRKDGFVLLLNLRPSDVRHGSAALVAGESHAGTLAADRLQGIYDGTMKPRLAAGDLPGALSAALDQVAADLQAPAPAESAPPSRSTSPGAVAGILFGLAALVAFILGGVVLLARGWSGNRPPGSRPPGNGPPPGSFGGGGSFFDSSGGGAFTGGDGGASSGSSSGGGSF